MVEKVARALAAADGKDPDAPAWVRYSGPEGYGLCWRDQYADKARAAIDAMYEPTERVWLGFGIDMDFETFTAFWQAGIRAALSPTVETAAPADADGRD